MCLKNFMRILFITPLFKLYYVTLHPNFLKMLTCHSSKVELKYINENRKKFFFLNLHSLIISIKFFFNYNRKLVYI